MNNYEKIQRMTAEGLAKFLSEHSMCDLCTCEMEAYSCMAIGCEEGIYKWLTGEIMKDFSEQEIYLLNQELDELKAENDNLKQECDLYKTWYRAKHDDLKNFLGQLKAENAELKSKLDMQESMGYPLCFTCIVEDCECNKSKLYKQCLNEIEEMCKLSLHCDNCYDILQKIKEVKGET